MTATNMCSNFGGKWACPPLMEARSIYHIPFFHTNKIDVIPSPILA